MKVKRIAYKLEQVSKMLGMFIDFDGVYYFFIDNNHNYNGVLVSTSIQKLVSIIQDKYREV